MTSPVRGSWTSSALALVWGGVVVGLAYMLGEHVAILLRNAGLTVLVIILGLGAYALHKMRQRRKESPPPPATQE